MFDPPDGHGRGQRADVAAGDGLPDDGDGAVREHPGDVGGVHRAGRRPRSPGPRRAAGRPAASSEPSGASSTAPRTSCPATTTCSTSSTVASASAPNIRAVTPGRSTPTTVACKVVSLTRATLPGGGDARRAARRPIRRGGRRPSRPGRPRARARGAGAFSPPTTPAITSSTCPSTAAHLGRPGAGLGRGHRGTLLDHGEVAGRRAALPAGPAGPPPGGPGLGGADPARPPTSAERAAKPPCRGRGARGDPRPP